MKKIFSVIISDTEYDVYNIKGKEHLGLNDTPKEWWIYFAPRLPEGTLPPIDSEYWEPWNVSILRHLIEVKITQRNTTKEKWGETDFRSNTRVEIYCNKKLLYAFGTGGKYLDFAMAKVKYMLVVLAEHPFNFYNPDEENGRKIYWKGLPATVKIRSGEEKWEIGIVPDYTCGLSKKEWWEELSKREKNIGGKIDKEDEESDKEDFAESMQSDYINWGDAFHDQHIGWFRKI